MGEVNPDRYTFGVPWSSEGWGFVGAVAELPSLLRNAKFKTVRAIGAVREQSSRIIPAVIFGLFNGKQSARVGAPKASRDAIRSITKIVERARSLFV